MAQFRTEWRWKVCRRAFKCSRWLCNKRKYRIPLERPTKSTRTTTSSRWKCRPTSKPQIRNLECSSACATCSVVPRKTKARQATLTFRANEWQCSLTTCRMQATLAWWFHQRSFWVNQEKNLASSMSLMPTGRSKINWQQLTSPVLDLELWRSRLRIWCCWRARTKSALVPSV